MAYRPYFNRSVEELRGIFEQSKNNLKTMKILQYELKHRSVPKARALKLEVDEVVRIRGTATANIPAPQLTPRAFAQQSPPPVTQQQPSPLPSVPERLAVDCGYCNTANFISVADGVQHLSCSQCKRLYTATYKYGVLRTSFPPLGQQKTDQSPIWLWGIIGVLLLVVLALIQK